MKRRISSILIALAFIVGISLLLYPTVSNYVNSKHQTQAIRSYDEAASKLTVDDFDKVFAAADDYNQRLYEEPDAFEHPELVEGYDSILDITGTGIMGYITIDKINVTLPIYHTVDENVLQIAVGHLPGTSIPVGGKNTHSVLSGHRGLPTSRLFTDLDRIDIGDKFVITILNREMTYQVDQILTVLPYEIEELKIKDGMDYCTLITCTPYGINSHRLLVRGIRVENETKQTTVYIANEAYQIDPLVVTPIMAAPMLLVLAVVMIIQGRRQRKKRRVQKKVENHETK